MKSTATRHFWKQFHALPKVIGKFGLVQSMIRWREEKERRALRSEIARNGFWFVDIPRTSSSSIKMELAERFGPLYGKRKLLDDSIQVKSSFRDHRPAAIMREWLGPELWDRLLTFSVVRNPWERMQSLYRYRQAKGHLPPTLGFCDYMAQLDCPSYVLRSSPGYQPAYHYPQLDYLRDESGIMLVKKVIPYERRQVELARIGNSIGCPSLGSHLHLQQARPDAAYPDCRYDSRTVDLVARVYAEEIAHFGYEPPETH